MGACSLSYPVLVPRGRPSRAPHWIARMVGRLPTSGSPTPSRPPSRTTRSGVCALGHFSSNGSPTPCPRPEATVHQSRNRLADRGKCAGSIRSSPQDTRRGPAPNVNPFEAWDPPDTGRWSPTRDTHRAWCPIQASSPRCISRPHTYAIWPNLRPTCRSDVSIPCARRWSARGRADAGRT